MNMPAYCGFCLKRNDNVKYMIVGLTANICNECLDLCVDMINEKLNRVTDPADNPEPKEV